MYHKIQNKYKHTVSKCTIQVTFDEEFNGANAVFYGAVAQRVERWTCDQQVLGSNSTWGKSCVTTLSKNQSKPINQLVTALTRQTAWRPIMCTFLSESTDVQGSHLHDRQPPEHIHSVFSWCSYGTSYKSTVWALLNRNLHDVLVGMQTTHKCNEFLTNDLRVLRPSKYT